MGGELLAGHSGWLKLSPPLPEAVRGGKDELGLPPVGGWAVAEHRGSRAGRTVRVSQLTLWSLVPLSVKWDIVILASAGGQVLSQSYSCWVSVVTAGGSCAASQ